MGRCSNWTIVRETIPLAVTSNSLSLTVIWAELSKVSIQPQLFIRHNPAALARASDYENVFSLFHKFKEETSKHQVWTHNMKCMARAPLRVLISRSNSFLSQWTWNCKDLTKKPCNFIGLLLLNLLIIQSFKEDVQDQYIFSGERAESKPTDFISGGIT